MALFVIWALTNELVAHNLETDLKEKMFPGTSVADELNLRTRYGLRVKESLALFKENPGVDLANIKIFVVRDCSISNAWINQVPAVLSSGKKFFRLYLCDSVLEDFDRNELAALLAHEIAHAEDITKDGSVNIAAHWLVDERAAQLSSREGVISMLKKIKKSWHDFPGRYRNWDRLFCVALGEYDNNRGDTMADMDFRINYISNLKIKNGE